MRPARVPLIKGDPILLEQVVFNLLDNAEKHVPPGTTTRVTLRTDGPEIVLTVEDEGPGIPAAELEKILRNSIACALVTGAQPELD